MEGTNVLLGAGTGCGREETEQEEEEGGGMEGGEGDDDGYDDRGPMG